MRSLAQVLVGSCCARSSRSERSRSPEVGEDDPPPKRPLAAARSLHPLRPSGESSPRRAGSDGQLEEGKPPVPGQDSRGRPANSNYVGSLFTVATALLLYLYEGLSYNFIFLFRIVPARGKGLLAPFLFILFNTLWALALWSYLQAHRSDPGAVPQRWRDFAKGLGELLPVAPARLEYQPGRATWCKCCCFPRPERAHHCHVCGICVLRMDHHCPFIANCVGFKNHKYFLLLVVYTTSSCGLLLLSSLPELFYCLGLLFRVFADHKIGTGLATSWVAACVVDLLLTIVLVPMLPAHLTLAVRNQTSIEGNYSNMPNPFDLGEPLPNLRQVLGEFGPDWFVPIQPWRPLGDGVSFLKADEADVLGASGDEGEEKSAQGSQTQDQALLQPRAREAEQLWRQRYGVRRTRALSDHGAPGSPRNAAGPLDAIAIWWRGLRK